jgi:hypothetical protein
MYHECIDQSGITGNKSDHKHHVDLCIKEMHACMRGHIMNCLLRKENFLISYHIVTMVRRGVGWP